MPDLDPEYSAAVATYRRPQALAAVLRSVAGQSLAPASIVVVDNDPLRSAEPVVAAIGPAIPLTYVAMGENVGPAGAWAAGAATLANREDRGAWLLVVDDDDPLGHPDLVRRLLATVDDLPSTCAAIGLRGATLRRSTGRLIRGAGPEGSPTAVEYLASGGAPLYRWAAVDEVGFFDERLFFGFEDLDEGVRLRASGWTLWAVSLPSLHAVAETATERTPWREYYKTRSLSVILRRRVGLAPFVATTLRSVVLGSLRLLVTTRDPRLATARALGWLDGIRGHLGRRRYEPSSNPAKRLPPVDGAE